MSAARIYRTTLSRLAVSEQNLPPPSRRLGQPSLRGFADCTSGAARQAIREHRVQRWKGRHQSGGVPLLLYQPSSRGYCPENVPAVRAIHDRRNSGRPKSSRFSKHVLDRMLRQPNTVQENSGQTCRGGRPDDAVGTQGPSARRSGQGSQPERHGRRPPPSSESKRQRVSAIIRNMKPRNHADHGRLSPKARDRLKIQQSMYKQWGYIRHQYPKSEVLPARRAFKAWKVKLSHVLEPADDPAPWPWREDGKWLFELDTLAAMRAAWESIDQETRRQMWPLVMLSTMHLCPDKASLVLDATSEPLPPGYAIHDVLLIIAQRLDLDRFTSVLKRTLRGEQVLDLATKTVKGMPVGHVPFGQRTFGLLARKLAPDQTGELYKTLRAASCKLHANTLVHFARKLAGDTAWKETACEILKDLADAGFDLNQARTSSVITSLLHCKARNDGLSRQGSQFSPQDALQFFVKRGFSPNVINSTALLDSLCQNSEVEEAIRLALLLAECGVQLDTKAWATVFRGAKTSLRAANIARAFDVAKAASAPYVDVLNNALHSVFYFAEMESRERMDRAPWVLPLFAPMLRVYAKKFDLEPLQWWLPDSLPLLLSQSSEHQDVVTLGDSPPRRFAFHQTILPVVDEFFSVGEGPKLQPNSTTIGIMLRCYIRSLRQPFDLLSFYGFFKSRLQEQGKMGGSATQLVKNQRSLIHDTIILAMTERRGLLRPALQVFGDMLKEGLKCGISESCSQDVGSGSGVATPPVHPLPTVLTYTIVLRGLMNSGERKLAEQLIQVMREENIEPNIVTWNTQVKGYASMQKVSRTVATLQDMEAAGFHPDVHTFKAFGRLKNQARAMSLMEGIIAANRQKMEDEWCQ